MRLVIALLISFLSSLVLADTVYQKPEDFLHEIFGGALPAPRFVWLDVELQKSMTAVLGHPYTQARIRYWRDGARTVWILDEIGKEFPITAAFVVASEAKSTDKKNASDVKHTDDKIALARVLVYRETRGDEIHIPAFLNQFFGLHLSDQKLTGKVDGITGATLSVGAMKKMAHAALVLNRVAP